MKKIRFYKTKPADVVIYFQYIARKKLNQQRKNLDVAAQFYILTFTLCVDAQLKDEKKHVLQKDLFFKRIERYIKIYKCISNSIKIPVYQGIILRREVRISHANSFVSPLLCSRLIKVNVSNILAFPACVWKNKLRGTLKETLKNFYY